MSSGKYRHLCVISIWKNSIWIDSSYFKEGEKKKKKKAWALNKVNLMKQVKCCSKTKHCYMLCQTLIFICQGERKKKDIYMRKTRAVEKVGRFRRGLLFKYEGLLDIFCTALAAHPCRISPSCRWNCTTCWHLQTHLAESDGILLGETPPKVPPQSPVSTLRSSTHEHVIALHKHKSTFAGRARRGARRLTFSPPLEVSNYRM